jgi:hypothetical protein
MTRRRTTRDCRRAAAFAHLINSDVALLAPNRRRGSRMRFSPPRPGAAHEKIARPRRTVSVVACKTQGERKKRLKPLREAPCGGRDPIRCDARLTPRHLHQCR